GVVEEGWDEYPVDFDGKSSEKGWCGVGGKHCAKHSVLNVTANPSAHVAPAGQHVAPEILAAHSAWIKGSKEIVGLMLMTMESEIQQNLENLHDHEMLLELKTIAIPRDGIFEIDLSNSYTNESSIYVVSNKRAKLDLDSALLWHCRLRHIIKKRIEKLQHDGLLNLTDLRAFEKCVPCMSRKMARKPYTHQVERAKDLFGLIHTDGEYTSQEFLDYLKDHGIIAHRTPPYTPQHNKVSERRNRTLLDMVRSMMSQTTLLKSFWDYALETVAPILNMVPTKKVEKIPYEVWHGQAPKLSYLKVWGCEALVKRDTLTKPDKL
nr:retrotransposon protein, putative, Ty1-copia subclass [Tanacetum cinerariifolium]